MLHPWNYPCAAAALDLQRGYIDSLQTYSKDFVKSTLKTLFNIMEERLKKIVELWCLCCIMMFRKVNKQPGMQKFWNWCSHYQEIYDWISPLNKRAGSAFILTLTVVYGEKWVWWIWAILANCLFSLFWSNEWCFWSTILSGLHFNFTPYQRHWYHLGPCSSDFFKVKHC